MMLKRVTVFVEVSSVLGHFGKLREAFRLSSTYPDTYLPSWCRFMAPKPPGDCLSGYRMCGTYLHPKPYKTSSTLSESSLRHSSWYLFSNPNPQTYLSNSSNTNTLLDKSTTTPLVKALLMQSRFGACLRDIFGKLSGIVGGFFGSCLGFVVREKDLYKGMQDPQCWDKSIDTCACLERVVVVMCVPVLSWLIVFRFDGKPTCWREHSKETKTTCNDIEQLKVRYLLQ